MKHENCPVKKPHEDAEKLRERKKSGVKGGRKVYKHGPKFKRFNMNTYKARVLGAYVNAIRMYGTTDNYTTNRYVSFNI
jgi:hypothetical protein